MLLQPNVISAPGDRLASLLRKGSMQGVPPWVPTRTQAGARFLKTPS